MGAASRPFRQLLRHSMEGATGEFIAVTELVEVHVYLQAGRLAWATTTAERFVFLTYLKTVHSIEPGLLREALAESYRERRPFGETLVQWSVVTFAQVKEGLRAQVLASLSSLRALETAQTLFLPRGSPYAGYDVRLTFDGNEVGLTLNEVDR